MWNCLCCLRVGGKKDGGYSNPELGIPARGKVTAAWLEKEKLQENFLQNKRWGKMLT